ncbi:hypothetical protein Metev_0480 [Methanohalobium evestigatum Z-7303]|uniref:Uncharacterized protein n=2 Tax=Methanohalobium evestigatum TaxID=2322 RepID=D7E852_METEZ|nr:hypothetical protein Metev_0480 [Methanohalobium evestigatum Z-7303]
MFNEDDSAQMILITGFAIGISIVFLTVMLNNVIYSSNMASESSIDTYRFDYSNAIKISSDAAEDAFINATDNQSFNSDIFNQYMSSYVQRISNLYAYSGLAVSVKNSSVEDAYLTDNGIKNGNSNWTIVDNINTTDNFLLYLSNNTGAQGDQNNSFKISAINQSDTLIWSIELYNESGDINVTVTNRTDTITTDTKSDIYQMDIINNSIDGNSFSFNFDESINNDGYYLKINNGRYLIGQVVLSGKLINNQDFTVKRLKVTRLYINMSSNSKQVNATVPVTLP